MLDNKIDLPENSDLITARYDKTISRNGNLQTNDSFKSE